MRALESELRRTFPAIKKQVDSLDKSEAVTIQKAPSGRSIYLQKEFKDIAKSILLYALEKEINTLADIYEMVIDRHYLGKAFWFDIESDIILIYKNCEKEQLDKIKEEVWEIFKKYFIETVYITCMSYKEREQRYRLADRFVLRIMREVKTTHS